MVKIFCAVCFVICCNVVCAGADVNASASNMGQKTDLIAKANELAQAGQPESQNAWPDYEQAGKLLKAMPQVIKDKDKSSWPGTWSKEDVNVLRTWVGENKDALAMAQAGSKKQGCWAKYESASGKLEDVTVGNLSELRQVTYALMWRARLEASDGNSAAALNDILTCYQMGAHMAGPKTLVEQLVGIAIRGRACGEAFTILDHQKLEPKLLKDFQNKLEIIQNGTDLAINLNVESLFGAQSIGKVETLASRERASRLGMITMLAILRYKADKENYPASLDELVKAGYLKSMPIDPFDLAGKKSLVYKKTENNFILYTIGENMEDDGGRHSDKWGTGDAGGDYVFWPVQQGKKPGKK